MKQYLKIELLVEIPKESGVVVVKPDITQLKPDSTTNTPNNKMTMSVGEVAAELQVSETTIYTMARLNEIPHKKVRGRILFHRATIERWLISNMGGSGMN